LFDYLLPVPRRLQQTKTSIRRPPFASLLPLPPFRNGNDKQQALKEGLRPKRLCLKFSMTTNYVTDKTAKANMDSGLRHFGRSALLSAFTHIYGKFRVVFKEIDLFFNAYLILTQICH
jgi:hypothetical protein